MFSAHLVAKLSEGIHFSLTLYVHMFRAACAASIIVLPYLQLNYDHGHQWRMQDFLKGGSIKITHAKLLCHAHF